MSQRALDTGPEHHQGCLELVAGVGGKAVQTSEALLQPGQHPIHRQRQSRHLIA
jgi:hypothetical protein